MLDVGRFVRGGSGEAIRHFESPRRDVERVFLFNARNHILFCLAKTFPMPYGPAPSARDDVQFDRLRDSPRPRGMDAAGHRAEGGWTWCDTGAEMDVEMCRENRTERHAVRRRTYRLSRWIKKASARRTKCRYSAA